MGRSSNKPKFAPSTDESEMMQADPGTKHSAEYEQKQIEMLLNRPARMSWEEYKERHKDQLADKMGAAVEKQTQEYRRQLDEERQRKLARGSNHKPVGDDKEKKDKKSKKSKKEKKEKKKEKKRRKKEKKKEKKRRRDEGDEDNEEGGSKKRKRKDDSDSSSSSSSSSDSEANKDEEEDSGPVRLSDFHKGAYDD